MQTVTFRVWDEDWVTGYLTDYKAACDALDKQGQGIIYRVYFDEEGKIYHTSQYAVMPLNYESKTEQP